MATSGKIHLVGQEKPIYQVPPLKKDTAEKVSGLLQENLDTHHCFFNDKGFHVCGVSRCYLNFQANEAIRTISLIICSLFTPLALPLRKSK